jgi:hypothetical protein
MPKNVWSLRLVSVGFTGAIAYFGICFASMLSSGYRGVSEFVSMWTLTWLAILIFELMLERTMYRVVYEPQP